MRKGPARDLSAEAEGVTVDAGDVTVRFADGTEAPLSALAGHNSTLQSVAADRLKAFVERIERLEEEKKAIAGDIRDVYGEAKMNGFDVKTIRKIVALRRKTDHERAEEDAILDLYKSALGMG